MLAALLATSALGLAGSRPAAVKLAPAQEQRPATARVPEAWTRLHEALARRTLPDGEVVGLDEAELLLWYDSTYLLQEARQAELRLAFEAFRAAGPRGPEVDGLRRVLLQQELWAAFDWAFAHSHWPASEDHDQTLAFARELAEVLALSAPTAAELDGLTSNLDADDSVRSIPLEPDASDAQRPFLPKGLGSDDGAWVYVRDGTGGLPLARLHCEVLAGRSQFGIALQLPGGREATRAWIESLPASGVRCDGASCSPMPHEPPREHEHLDRSRVHVPAGTMVALVQRALAFDDRGVLRVTPLVLRVQVRAYFAIPEDVDQIPLFSEPEGWPWQAFAEHRLVPSRWLAGSAGNLVALQRGESAYTLIGVHGDQIEHAEPARGGERPFGRLDACISCHGAIGLASLNSYTGIMSGPNTQLDVRLPSLPRALVPADDETLSLGAVVFKRSRSDWGALWAWGWGAQR